MLNLLGIFKMQIETCSIIDLPKVSDVRGNLTFVEGLNHIPFSIKRVFYLYDIPGGCDRGAHAHRESHQFLIALSGSFDVELNDGTERKYYQLNRSYYGLYIPTLVWAHLKNFSSGAVCMVLASEVFDEADYIRDYNIFIDESRKKHECAIF